MSYKTFREAREALEKGETNCETLVSSFFENIEKGNTRYNIFLSTDKEGALSRARELDANLKQGAQRPLAGMIMGIKDVICIKGRPVTCGSRILAGFKSLYNATAIERLYEAGAIFVGKTNCDEFAMGSSNENSAYGPVLNPLNPEYVPGGSSGGSAAAVAAEMCHTTLGTDTGGSIRQPAAFCGVVGMKPTYGRVSRYGLVAYASSLDCIGPIGHTVEDVAEVLQVIAGIDPCDATSGDAPVGNYTRELTGDVKGLRIGLPIEYFSEGLDGEIAQMLKDEVVRLESLGAVIKDVSLPHTEYGVATYYIIATAEASSNLARYDGIRYGHRTEVNAIRKRMEADRVELQEAISLARSNGQEELAGELKLAMNQQQSLVEELYVQTRTEGFGDEVKNRILLGTYVLSAGYYDAYYGKAQFVRQRIRRDFSEVFEDVDLLLAPATPTPPFKLESKTDNPLEMYLEDIYTVTANLAGIPALTVPIGNHSIGLPVGMQLLGRHYDEGLLLKVGHTAMKNRS